MSRVRGLLKSPVLKVLVCGGLVVLWIAGLADQWHSWEMMGKYVGISAVMASIALLT